VRTCNAIGITLIRVVCFGLDWVMPNVSYSQVRFSALIGELRVQFSSESLALIASIRIDCEINTCARSGPVLGRGVPGSGPVTLQHPWWGWRVNA